MARDFQSMLSRSLNERRSWESDIKYRLYVRPLGNRGLHVVKSSIDGQEYIVSGPGRTFRPGTVVPTGSNTGTQGEFIVSDPPPGRRGAGRVSQEKWTHQAGGCPQSITGRTYIGIVDKIATHTLYAYSYADGKLGALIDQITLPTELQHSSSERWGWQLADSSTIVWSQEITGGNETQAIWDLGGSAGKIDHDSSNFMGNTMVYNGQLYYLLEGSSDQAKAYRVNPVIGASSTFDGNIEDGGREMSQDIVVINGDHYTYSSDGSPDRWVSLTFTGPENTLGTGYVGGPIAFGGCVIGSFNQVKWVQQDLSTILLWPAGWISWSWTLPLSHGAQVNVSLTPLEYSVYDPASGSLVRFGAIQNFSAIDIGRCPIPAIPVELSPQGRPDVMLPL